MALRHMTYDLVISGEQPDSFLEVTARVPRGATLLAFRETPRSATERADAKTMRILELTLCLQVDTDAPLVDSQFVLFAPDSPIQIVPGVVLTFVGDVCLDDRWYLVYQKSLDPKYSIQLPVPVVNRK